MNGVPRCLFRCLNMLNILLGDFNFRGQIRKCKKIFLFSLDPSVQSVDEFYVFFLQDQFLFCKWRLIGSAGILISRERTLSLDRPCQDLKLCFREFLGLTPRPLEPFFFIYVKFHDFLIVLSLL